MVAVFSTLLVNKVATLVAGFQPGLIQAMFILTDLGRHITLNLSLAAITVLPLVVLLMMLIRDSGQVDDREKRKNPIGCDKETTTTQPNP